ncbi:hypothetical protein BY996DRAFT_6412869 [Phakopsora pachyrhizi]|nr:hypothetical protein BY996DRAFT_6412869 [Phakopsora pachyrhizi]
MRASQSFVFISVYFYLFSAVTFAAPSLKAIDNEYKGMTRMVKYKDDLPAQTASLSGAPPLRESKTHNSLLHIGEEKVDSTPGETLNPFESPPRDTSPLRQGKTQKSLSEIKADPTENKGTARDRNLFEAEKSLNNNSPSISSGETIPLLLPNNENPNVPQSPSRGNSYDVETPRNIQSEVKDSSKTAEGKVKDPPKNVDGLGNEEHDHSSHNTGSGKAEIPPKAIDEQSKQSSKAVRDHDNGHKHDHDHNHDHGHGQGHDHSHDDSHGHGKPHDHHNHADGHSHSHSHGHHGHGHSHGPKYVTLESKIAEGIKKAYKTVINYLKETFKKLKLKIKNRSSKNNKTL